MTPVCWMGGNVTNGSEVVGVGAHARGFSNFQVTTTIPINGLSNLKNNRKPEQE